MLIFPADNSTLLFFVYHYIVWCIYLHDLPHLFSMHMYGINEKKCNNFPFYCVPFPFLSHFPVESAWLHSALSTGAISGRVARACSAGIQFRRNPIAPALEYNSGGDGFHVYMCIRTLYAILLCRSSPRHSQHRDRGP